MGKVIAILIAFLGVCAVAVPTGIISAGFFEKFSKSEHSDKRFNDIREVGEILCDKKSGLIGMTYNEIFDKYEARVYMIIRGELTIVPNDCIRTEENDILIVNTKRLVKKGKKR